MERSTSSTAAQDKVLQKYRSREAAANPTQQGFTPLGKQIGKPLANTLENAIHGAWLNEDGELLVLGKLLPVTPNVTIVYQWGKLNIETGKITPMFNDTLLNNGSFPSTPTHINDSTLLVGSQVSGMPTTYTHTAWCGNTFPTARILTHQQRGRVSTSSKTVQGGSG
jgi:hypothetical protein